MFNLRSQQTFRAELRTAGEDHALWLEKYLPGFRAGICVPNNLESRICQMTNTRIFGNLVGPLQTHLCKERTKHD